MKYIGNAHEFLHLESLNNASCSLLSETPESSLTVLWFVKQGSELSIDGKSYAFEAGQIVFLTEFHKVSVAQLEDVRFLRFNRPFFCVLDHDAEVGCKGVLFFGASRLPIVALPENEKSKFETLWQMFNIEMQSDDSLQLEMLQMMLKRYLILCTRLYKGQAYFPEDNLQSDIVRDFNFLVEQHFRQKHTLSEYASLLNRSPKTISNIFSKIGTKTPLQYIQERRALEARRLLRYSDTQVKQIAWDIGFKDIQAFSRFFKNMEGISPVAFREKANQERLPTLQDKPPN